MPRSVSPPRSKRGRKAARSLKPVQLRRCSANCAALVRVDDRPYCDGLHAVQERKAAGLGFELKVGEVITLTPRITAAPKPPRIARVSLLLKRDNGDLGSREGSWWMCGTYQGTFDLDSARAARLEAQVGGKRPRGEVWWRLVSHDPLRLQRGSGWVALPHSHSNAVAAQLGIASLADERRPIYVRFVVLKSAKGEKTGWQKRVVKR